MATCANSDASCQTNCDDYLYDVACQCQIVDCQSTVKNSTAEYVSVTTDLSPSGDVKTDYLEVLPPTPISIYDALYDDSYNTPAANLSLFDALGFGHTSASSGTCVQWDSLAFQVDSVDLKQPLQLEQLLMDTSSKWEEDLFENECNSQFGIFPHKFCTFEHKSNLNLQLILHS